MQNEKTLDYVESFVPLFPGFYTPSYDALVDAEVDLLVDDYADNFPTLDRGSLFDAIYSNVDYSEVYKRIAQIHVEVFIKHLTEAVRELPGFGSQTEPAWRFVRVVSPREYNFETDRVLIHIEESFIRRLFEVRDKDMFAKVVRDRHSSRSGFVSFYSDDANASAWSDVGRFDCNQIETLLLSIIEQTVGAGDFYEGVIAEVSDEAATRYIVGDCLNYDAVETKLGAINEQAA